MKKCRNKNQTKPWYDKECSDAKKDFMQARNVFRRSKTDHSESEMKRQSKMYKNIIRLKKQNHSRQLHSALKNLKSSNPKDYWKLINRKK